MIWCITVNDITKFDCMNLSSTRETWGSIIDVIFYNKTHSIRRSGRIIGSSYGPGPGSTSLDCSILVPSPTLTRHRPIQGRVQVRRRVRSRVPGRDRFRHEIGLIPAGLPVDLSQFLMLPHRIQNLSGKFDDSGCEPVSLPSYGHQPVHASGLE